MVNPLEAILSQVMQGTAPQGGGSSFAPYQGLFQTPQANPMLMQIMQALQQGGLGSLIAQPGTSLDIQPRVGGSSFVPPRSGFNPEGPFGLMDLLRRRRELGVGGGGGSGGGAGAGGAGAPGGGGGHGGHSGPGGRT